MPRASARRPDDRARPLFYHRSGCVPLRETSNMVYARHRHFEEWKQDYIALPIHPRETGLAKRTAMPSRRSSMARGEMPSRRRQRSCPPFPRRLLIAGGSRSSSLDPQDVCFQRSGGFGSAGIGRSSSVGDDPRDSSLQTDCLPRCPQIYFSTTSTRRPSIRGSTCTWPCAANERRAPDPLSGCHRLGASGHEHVMLATEDPPLASKSRRMSLWHRWACRSQLGDRHGSLARAEDAAMAAARGTRVRCARQRASARVVRRQSPRGHGQRARNSAWRADEHRVRPSGATSQERRDDTRPKSVPSRSRRCDLARVEEP